MSNVVRGRAVRTLTLAFIGVFLGLGVSVTGAEDALGQTVWPKKQWRKADPSEQGIDPSVLDALHKRIRRGEFGYVDQLVVIRNGHLVFDERYQNDYVAANADRDPAPHQYNYFNPNWHPYYHGTDLHTLQSITKSVTSAVVGIAIGRGDLPGVEMRVLETFDEREVANLDERKRDMTLDDLLTMRSGLEWDEFAFPYDDARNPAAQLEASDDWVQFVIDRPMASEPGTHFSYSSGVSQLLSHIVSHGSGKPIDEYAREHLFRPLGIKKYYWKRTPTGLPDTEGGLYLTAHDLARIGYLYLNDGVWNGTRILPEGWVQSTSHPAVQDAWPQNPANNESYGYHWWLVPFRGARSSHILAGSGYGGQFLFVVPEKNLVAVFTGWNIYGPVASIKDAFTDYVLRAVVR